MSFTLQDVVTAARDRSQFFHQARIGNAVCARWCTDWQNELIGKALQREAHYLEQQIGIVVSFSDADDPGTAGANTSGGLPATADDSGNISVVEENAGTLIEALTSADDEAVVLVAERAVTSATSTTTTSSGSGRTTNADANKLIEITAGKGRGQQRLVTSNTATAWTHAAWETIPDVSSMIQIVDPSIAVDNPLGVVTGLPALSERRGYLVKLDASGVPYIDYTAPLLVNLDAGVPLPSAIAISGGTVRYNDGNDCPLTIASYGRRFDPPDFPAAWHANRTLYLCGQEGDWQDALSIEVLYSPVAPAFTALADLFLLPDAARPAAVAALADFMAQRVAGMDGVTVDTARFAVNAAQSEAAYLSSLRLSKRARTTVMRDGGN